MVVFHADQDGGVHFGIFGFVWALRTHKMAIKPAKMAVLGPNLKSDVPKYLEWAKLTQYSSFQCQQRWWGPFGHGLLCTHWLSQINGALDLASNDGAIEMTLVLADD